MARDIHRLAKKARRLRIHHSVSRVIAGLPPEVQAFLDNVAIIIEEEPSSDHREDAELGHDDELFGLYQGVPRTERNSAYSMVTPDRITIFAGPLERAYSTRREFEEQIRVTVLHEVGHHLGYDEAGLESLGLT